MDGGAAGKVPECAVPAVHIGSETRPIEKYIRTLPHKVVINCVGIGAQESKKRARQSAWSVSETLTTIKRVVYNWLPIFEESEQDVLERHWRTGTPLHPVCVPEFHRDGTTGGYLRRFSCRLCIFASDHDVAAVAEHDPEAFAAIAQLEQRIGFTMKSGRSLFRILDDTKARQQADDQQCFAF